VNIYDEAVAVQDACNLSGVVKSFATILDKVWEEVRANEGGTVDVNHHPVCILFADKITQLAGIQNLHPSENLERAWDVCWKRKRGSDDSTVGVQERS